ncbi:MAG: prohibitin family protein [Prevotellaceae bacterium]|jgi:regulator of protease activity HflC (stomatin/prohibitin superfamily)|nr:prohibitin family protein [Prevotellaceae bacterium]
MRKINNLVLAALFLLTAVSCAKIDSGSVGIMFTKWSSDKAEYGGVVGTCKGFVWYNPFTRSVFEYPVFVQRKSFDNILVNARDASTFNISPVLAYRLNPEKAIYVFTKYRKPLSDIEEGYIQTCIYEAYRTCGNTYTSDYLMSNREEFEKAVRARLDESMTKEGFIVEEFTAQITPPPSLRNAIDAKNEAIQNALKAENKVREAEANAKIEIAKASGEAQALKIKGDGEAYYNRVVAASLNQLLVNQYAIERWDGKLPVYSGNATPFINVK